MSPPALSPPPSWWRQLLRSTRAYWLVKTVAITGGISLFFVGYFWVLHHPARPPLLLQPTLLDDWIGFQPWTLPFYFSLWIYVTLPACFLQTPRELFRHALTVTLMAVTGLAIFYRWPTAVPPSPIDWTQHPGFDFLKSSDASANACPSLHAAFAVLAALWCGSFLRRLQAPGWVRMANWLWCAGILFSTLGTRQHLVIDVVAGCFFGLLFVPLPRLRIAPAPASPTGD